MTLLNFFLSKKKPTANLAKKRLQVIVSENSNNSKNIIYLVKLQRDILSVVSKYVKMEPKMLSMQLEHKNINFTILKLKIILNGITKKNIVKK
uniref:Cell division topological specificity factor n=1 Tax=Candidatus Aschnera chinzeii TaxID=1485666 RepID=A0AAT9G4T8_9ENTR|nr:MAG: cell division topological specificity factor MinE [Candidatus Aschnera chinzeii]